MGVVLLGFVKVKDERHVNNVFPDSVWLFSVGVFSAHIAQLIAIETPAGGINRFKQSKSTLRVKVRLTSERVHASCMIKTVYPWPADIWARFCEVLTGWEENTCKSGSPTEWAEVSTTTTTEWVLIFCVKLWFLSQNFCDNKSCFFLHRSPPKFSAVFFTSVWWSVVRSLKMG